MRLTPKNELEYRYRKLQQMMAGAGIDAVVVLQKADLFYFTGTVQSGPLYVPAEGDPIYLVRQDFLRARMESALKEVLPCSCLEDLPGRVADFGLPLPGRIGWELDVLPVALFERLRALFPGAAGVDASPLIRRLRTVKSHYEIHILQDAAQQADKVFRLAGSTLRAGMSELELVAELERQARLEGHHGLVRLRSFNEEASPGRVLSGSDAAAPAAAETVLGGMGLTPAFGQGASYRRIDPHEPVLVELSAAFDGYHVAQSRVLSLGEPSERMRRGHDDMLEVQRVAVEAAGRGEGWGEIHAACHAEARRRGYEGYFMGGAGAAVPWVGHGVGIELDEFPFLAAGFTEDIREPGVVFTLEPKLVFPGEGAVGIENTFYLSGEGVKQLTFSGEELLIVPYTENPFFVKT